MQNIPWFLLVQLLPAVLDCRVNVLPCYHNTTVAKNCHLLLRLCHTFVVRCAVRSWFCGFAVQRYPLVLPPFCRRYYTITTPTLPRLPLFRFYGLRVPACWLWRICLIPPFFYPAMVFPAHWLILRDARRWDAAQPVRCVGRPVPRSVDSLLVSLPGLFYYFSVTLPARPMRSAAPFLRSANAFYDVIPNTYLTATLIMILPFFLLRLLPLYRRTLLPAFCPTCLLPNTYWFLDNTLF